MNSVKENLGEVILYQTEDGKTAIDVRLEGETVWINQKQIATLFDIERSVVTKHINKIFKDGELDKSSVSAKFAQTAADGKTYQTSFYNLDVIIAVGYRVNAKRGTQFRIWATQILGKHLIDGYTLNERRLREQGLTEAQQAIQVLSRTLNQYELVSEQGREILDVISRYAKSWLLLQRYDENQLAPPVSLEPTHTSLSYEQAKAAITELKTRLTERQEASALFGQERGDHLAAIIGAVEQTFDGQSLYPSIEEKAAHLLYFIIKDHPFADGNKRIGSFLFILFLRQNQYLEDASGSPKINDNALVALALLTAESEAGNKELMIHLMMNLLAERGNGSD